VLAPVRCRRWPDTAPKADGTQAPRHDRRAALSSKNWCFSAYLEMAIDANPRLTVAVGPLPGNHNASRAE